MRTPPQSTVSHYGVEDKEQLPHARHQGYLLGLARGQETLVKLLYLWVVAAGDQRSHVEGFSNPGPATPHGAPASESTGVTVERCHAYQGRKLSGRKKT